MSAVGCRTAEPRRDTGEQTSVSPMRSSIVEKLCSGCWREGKRRQRSVSDCQCGASFSGRGALLAITGGRQNSRCRLRIARATVPSPISRLRIPQWCCRVLMIDAPHYQAQRRWALGPPADAVVRLSEIQLDLLSRDVPVVARVLCWDPGPPTFSWTLKSNSFCAVTGRITSLTSVLMSDARLELQLTGPGAAGNVGEEILGVLDVSEIGNGNRIFDEAGSLDHASLAVEIRGEDIGR